MIEILFLKNIHYTYDQKSIQNDNSKQIFEWKSQYLNE